MKINNIINLLRQYFMENWKRDLWYLGFIIFFSIISSLEPEASLGISGLISVIFILIYAASSFGELKQKTYSVHFLMTPASLEEKLTTKILLANVYFVGASLLALFIGQLIGYLITTVSYGKEMLASANLFPFLISSWSECAELYMAIAILFFGGIYFKGRSALKTILTVVGIAFLYFFLLCITIYLNFKTIVPDGYSLHSIKDNAFSYFSNVDSLGIVPIASCIIFIIYFYAMSYLRLKETEA